jgi:hypothetical protein
LELRYQYEIGVDGSLGPLRVRPVTLECLLRLAEARLRVAVILLGAQSWR